MKIEKVAYGRIVDGSVSFRKFRLNDLHSETGFLIFLDASSHLYMRSCPSVGPSVGWMVTRFFKRRK